MLRDGQLGHEVDADLIARLEGEIEQLRAGMASRQQIGISVGLVAGRHGLTPDAAWKVLVRISQNTNAKIRDVGRVIHDTYAGQLAASDQELAARVDAQLGRSVGP